MKAEDVIREKFKNRTQCPKLTSKDEVILEEIEDKDDFGKLRGTIRHTITVTNLADNLRSALEDTTTDGPDKKQQKRVKIRESNIIIKDMKEIGTKIPSHILDFWEKEDLI